MKMIGMYIRMNKILKMCGFEPSRLRQEATALWHGGGEGVRTLQDRLDVKLWVILMIILEQETFQENMFNGINLRASKVGLGPRQLNCSLFVSDCLNFSHFQTSDPLEFACF